MDTNKLRKFATLTAAKRAKTAEIDAIEKELSELQEEILTSMSSEGVSSMRVDLPEGRFTISPLRQLWAGAVEGDYERACQALKAAGLGDLVEEKFNTNRLSSVVREMDAAGVPLPESFAGAIKVSEVFRLSVRRANGK